MEENKKNSECLGLELRHQKLKHFQCKTDSHASEMTQYIHSTEANTGQLCTKPPAVTETSSSGNHLPLRKPNVQRITSFYGTQTFKKSPIVKVFKRSRDHQTLRCSKVQEITKSYRNQMFKESPIVQEFTRSRNHQPLWKPDSHLPLRTSNVQ